MKKWISLLTVMVMLTGMFSALPGLDERAGAASPAADFDYTVTGNEVIITKYKGSDAYVIIPSAVNGNPVTQIGQRAFSYNEDIHSVTIPDSVKVIGMAAFEGCSYLQRADIPDSVTELGKWAFAASGIKSISIPGSVQKISASSFGQCRNLEYVTIEEGVKSIDEYAFSYSPPVWDSTDFSGPLINIAIPASVEMIDEDAFACILVMPDYDTVVVNRDVRIYTPAGSYAESFAQEKRIWVDTVNPLPTPTSIPTPTQKPTPTPAPAPTPAPVPTLAPTPAADVVSNYEYTAANNEVTITKYKGSIRHLIIPDSIGGMPVTAIGTYAFTDFWSDPHSEIREVVLPETIKTICWGAFDTCVNLQKINIPDSVTEIGEYAFSYTALTEITIPSRVRLVTRKMFYGSDITSVTLSPGVRGIEEDAFEDCDNLTSVIIPDSVRYIDQNAFRYSNNVMIYTYPGFLCGGLCGIKEHPCQLSYPASADTCSDTGGGRGFKLHLYDSGQRGGDNGIYGESQSSDHSGFN